MFKFLLYPISLLYGTIISIRNFFYDNGIFSSTEFNIPIISIGNITVGGTGKTPHTEYLVNLLKDKFDIATLSRGYKRKTKGFVEAESTKFTVNEIGDEPLQIRHKFPTIKVAVCENRVTGVKKLLHNHNNLDLVILDDAFQHRRIKPGLNILLVDYTRPINTDHILPYGRLRESHSQRSRANVIIITKTPVDLKPIDRRVIAKNLEIFPYQTIYFTYIKYGKLTPLYSSKNKQYTTESCKLDKPEALVITGIANPVPFYNYIHTNLTENTNKLKYPDHHNFSNKNLKQIIFEYQKIESKSKLIITTEKDAIRLRDKGLPEEIKENIYYIPIEIDFLFDEKDSFNQQIINYVTNDRTNYRLHTTMRQL